MLTSVKYSYEAGMFAWPIPFAFTKPEQVGVNIVDPSGLEKRLVYGVGYQIQGTNVIYVLAPGHALVIWLDAVVADVLAANNAAALSGLQPAAAFASLQPQPQAIAVQSETDSETSVQAASVDDATASRIAQLEAQLATLQEEKAQALIAARAKVADAEIQSLTATADKARAEIAGHVETAALAVEMAQASAEDAINDAAAAADSAAERADKAGELAKLASIYAEEKVKTSIKALEDRIAELETKLAKSVSDGEQAVALAVTQGQSRIALASQDAQAEAVRTAAQAATLAGQVWPQQGWLIAEADMAAGSLLTLPEPLAYYPGRCSLLVSLNGFILTRGQHYEEVGDSLTPATRIKLLHGCAAGDLWSVFIAPTNESQAAAIASVEAQEAATRAQAARAAAEAAQAEINTVSGKIRTEGTAKLAALENASSQAQRQIAALRDTALTELRDVNNTGRNDCVGAWRTATADIKKLGTSESEALRELWLKAQAAIAKVREDAQAKAEAAMREAARQATASSNAAAESFELTQCAWRAAWQASLDRAMPGIGSVPCYEELLHRPAGMYFINPMLKLPLPFMGVYPVDSLADAVGYDGVFLLGAAPYPEAPALPELPYPEAPGDVPEMLPPAMQANWLPCDHHHQ